MNKEKGFTLIELLAVIVILGVIMLIAIPMVTSYIENAKKDAFLDNARMAIRQARNDMISQDAGSCEFPAVGGEAVLATSAMNFEKEFTSPYTGEEMTQSYVRITSPSEGKYEYKYWGMDDEGNGLTNWLDEDSLKREEVKKKGGVSRYSGKGCNE